MLVTGASCTNEYVKEKEEKEKNTTFSAKCHKALLKYKRDYYLISCLYNHIPELFYIARLFFLKLLLKVGFR